MKKEIPQIKPLGRPPTGLSRHPRFPMLLNEEEAEFIRLEAIDKNTSRNKLLRSYFPRFWKAKLKKLKMDGPCSNGSTQ
jgi:hypothetical protein